MHLVCQWYAYMAAKAVHNLFYLGGQLVHTHALIIPMGFLRHAASPVHSDAQFFYQIVQLYNVTTHTIMTLKNYLNCLQLDLRE